jgi:hypothetical protein
MNHYNVWNKWDKLKTVILGDHYCREFFQDVKNSRIRSALQKIADETQEDLDYYERVLKDFGCRVLRPELNRNDSIMNYIDNNGKVSEYQGVPRSPLQPRDCQFVAGNKVFLLPGENPVVSVLEEYNKNDIVQIGTLVTIDEHKNNRHWSKDMFNNIAGTGWGTFEEYKNNPDYFQNLPPKISIEVLNYHRWCTNNIGAPSYTVVGRDIYVDQRDQLIRPSQLSQLSKNFPNLRLNKLYHGGHSDGCFHTLKLGVILSLSEIQTYENTFPGWDVCYLPDQSWQKVEGFLKIKNQVRGKWWVPGEEENSEFTHFVETWLQDWVGYVEETVFDVNVLVLDEHYVCVNNMNPTVIEFLKKHRMEPIHVPWRHRYFWDGGLHCITLDLEREGVQEDYFPERGDVGVIDHGFD